RKLKRDSVFLQGYRDISTQPTKGRPVLGVFEGGLSNVLRVFFFFGRSELLPRALGDGACRFAAPPRSASTLRRSASIRLMTFAGARSLGVSMCTPACFFFNSSLSASS